MTTEQPQRPPTSGPGSGAAAWRAYAAAVTDSPVESWDSLSRDEVMELLASEGAAPDPALALPDNGDGQVPVEAAPAEARPVSAEPRRRRRPEWMVPTPDGLVPESQMGR